MLMARIFLVFVAFLNSIPCFAQETRPQLPQSNKELWLRVASERERIVAYQVDVTIDEKSRKTGEKDWRPKPGIENLQIYMEYSKVDDHFVTAVKHSRQMSRDRRDWLIVGTSKGLFLRGASDNYCRFEDDIPGAHDNDYREYFDPRSIGLLGCDNWGLGALTRFEDCVSGSSDERNFSETQVSRDQDGMIELTSSYRKTRRDKLIIDDLKGYWPVSSESYNDSSSGFKKDAWSKVRTETSLKKIDGMYVPYLVQMICESGLNEEKYFLVTLEWHSVNKPLSAGTEGIERIAKRFNCKTKKIEDQRSTSK